ncbi:hypothetical protein CCR75_009455 [Bremia lactucae]|uniref:Uncharacterized protein n=1 Tax=Bremia lactucae TaxID=4779 RepID=A0A976IJD6_BRELC|nr:hypothetical protein CCR75_009455 [Bremia lactucae]
MEQRPTIKAANSGKVERPLTTDPTKVSYEERDWIPFYGKIKAKVNELPLVAKFNAKLDSNLSLKGIKLIIESQLKALAIIGVIALVGGFIMYKIKE